MTSPCIFSVSTACNETRGPEDYFRVHSIGFDDLLLLYWEITQDSLLLLTWFKWYTTLLHQGRGVCFRKNNVFKKSLHSKSKMATTRFLWLLCVTSWINILLPWVLVVGKKLNHGTADFINFTFWSKLIIQNIFGLFWVNQLQCQYS